jgi:cellulose synthase operon protein C
MNAVRMRLAAALLVLGQVACTDSRTDAQYLAEARRHLDRHDVPAAIIEAKNALSVSPQSVSARLLLAEAFLLSDDPTSADQELVKVQAQGLSADAWTPLRARVWLKMGKQKELIRTMGSTQLKDKTAAAELATHLARAHAMNRDLGQAKVQLDRALALKPDLLTARILAIRLMAAQGPALQALAAADDLLKTQAGQAEAWMLKGDLLRGSGGDPAAAKAAYEKVMALDPTQVDALSNLVELAIEGGQQQVAQGHLTALKKLAGKRPTTLMFEAQLAAQNKRYSEAQNILRQVVRSFPDNARVLQAAGANAFASGSPMEAEDLLSKAMSIDPEVAGVRHLLAYIRLSQNRPEPALKALAPLLKAKDPDLQTLKLAAQAYKDLGQVEAAAQALADAAKRRPEDEALQIDAVLTSNMANQVALDLSKLTTMAQRAKGVDADIKLIESLIQRKQFKEALSAIQAADSKAPNGVLFQTLTARVLWLQGHKPEARQAYALALSRDPKHLPAVAGLAGMDIEDRAFDQALARFQPLLADQPPPLEVLLSVADLERQAGKPTAELLKRIQSAIQAYPGSVAARVELIDLHLRAGDTKAAMDAADAAQAALPNTPAILERLGQTQLRVGRPQQARITFGTYLKLQPDQVSALIGEADALLALNDAPGAQRYVQRALSVAPRSPEALLAGINMALHDNQPTQAAALARRLIEAQPDQARPHLLLAQVEQLRSRHADAMAAFRQALKLNPENAAAAAGLYRSMLLNGKRDEAKQLAQNWLARGVDDGQFGLPAAEGAISVQAWGEAEHIYRQMLVRQPNHAVVLNNLAFVLMRQGKPGALGLAQQATKLSPTQLSFANTLALALADDKQYDKAIEVQSRIMAQAPNLPELRLDLAKILIQAKDTNRARTELLTLKRLGAQFRHQAEVLKLLQQLDAG